MKARFQSLWDALTPERQRQAVVIAALTFGVGLVVLMAHLAPEPKALSAQKQLARHLLTDADPRALGINAMAAELRAMQRRNLDLESRLESIEKMQQTVPEPLKTPENPKFDQWASELDTLKSKVESLERKPPPPAAEPAPVATQEALFFPEAGKPTAGSRAKDYRRLFETADSRGPGGTPRSLELKTLSNASAAGKPKGTGGDTDPGLFLPAGALISARLLNGLDAPTGRNARREPFPVLARIKQDAILPNRYRADLSECFLIASGYGDLSSERAYIRTESISCIRNDGGVIEVPVDAYAVGEDGKLGLRGTLVSKQGQVMANALMAGFARGISDAFGRTQVPVFMNGGSSQISSAIPYQSNMSPEAAEGGALKGAGSAMDRLAHYYMDLAESLFPVIEIDTTRAIDFVLQKGVRLKLDPEEKQRIAQASSITGRPSTP